jgi:hypothetical protein
MTNALAAGEIGVITPQQLDSYLGKSIGAICQNGYVSDGEHHGAHFVAHALGYKFGVTCQMMGTGKGPAATLRPQEIFAKCKAVGVWRLRPATLHACLVFVTRASNVNLAAKSMSNARRKNVGIFTGGFIWYYSDSQHAVVKQTPSQFAHHFPAPDNAMFYGTLP